MQDALRTGVIVGVVLTFVVTLAASAAVFAVVYSRWGFNTSTCALCLCLMTQRTLDVGGWNRVLDR